MVLKDWYISHQIFIQRGGSSPATVLNSCSSCLTSVDPTNISSRKDISMHCEKISDCPGQLLERISSLITWRYIHATMHYEKILDSPRQLPERNSSLIQNQYSITLTWNVILMKVTRLKLEFSCNPKRFVMCTRMKTRLTDSTPDSWAKKILKTTQHLPSH